jgi:hypothetical protein
MKRYLDYIESEFPLSISLYSSDKVIHNVGSREFTLSIVVRIPSYEIKRYTSINYKFVVLQNGNPCVDLEFDCIDNLMLYVQEYVKAETHKNTPESELHPSIRFHKWNKDE